MMEFQCPACGKRLRASDHYQNPKVRCPRCRYIFRPRELTAEEQVGAVEHELAESDYESEATFDTPATESAGPEVVVRRSGDSTPVDIGRKIAGSGVGFLILFTVLSAAPRLVKMFFNDRRPEREVPVQVDLENLQAIQVQRAMEKAAPDVDRHDDELDLDMLLPDEEDDTAGDRKTDGAI